MRAPLAATPGSPAPAPGTGELVVFWPLVVRTAWFLAGLLAVLVVGRLVVQPVVARAVRRRNRNNPTIQAAVVLYLRLLLLLVGLLVGVALAGYGRFLSDSALVVSAVALAVGFAAREVIGSLVSGIALVLDPEFNVGDQIRWDGGEGVVRAIALRVTRVETAAGELVTIPNTILTAHEITRPYGGADRRVVQHLGVAYEDDVAAVLTALEEAAAGVDRILATPPPAAYVDELDDDAVSVRVHYWIADPTRREVFAVRSAYARAAKERLEREGISIAPAPELDLQGEIGIDERSQEG